jgi:hypothetical protein
MDTSYTVSVGGLCALVVVVPCVILSSSAHAECSVHVVVARRSISCSDATVVCEMTPNSS